MSARSQKIIESIAQDKIKLSAISADELFIVIKGKITIKFRDKDLVANPGEIILIPRGVGYCPSVEEEAWVMLIEPKSVINTGEVEDIKTVKHLEKI